MSVLEDVDSILHLALPSMNMLNQNEPATFLIFLFWAFISGSIFSVFNLLLFKGYGENKAKSSTVPQEVKTLDGVYVHNVACGYGHALFMAQNDSEEDKNNLNKLPVYTPV